MTDFKQSQLWHATLKSRPKNDEHEAQRSRLSSAYQAFWKRGVRLAQRISSDVPGLTLHDEEHLTALWDRASQLIGESYPINPLEAFVLGGSILLHDAGHAIAAYRGGIAELKQSPEYRDAVAAVLRKAGANPPSEESIVNPSPEIDKIALFQTLRRLHAKQAEILAARPFEGEYLIDDNELRNNLAQLIGRIAASHHWDRNSLEDKLPAIQGPPGFMPQEWSIQPVKLACLLRCADAIQIDQRRAPAFAFALHAPEGISRLHWLAQQLAQPVVKIEKDGGPGALMFTSQNDFGEDHADAWWIAHDLLKIANDELQGCYQLMKDSNLSSFVVDRVAGIESPLKLERHIQTAGWRPIHAELRVSSVDRIVRLFGGSLLYGDDLTVPLRELIQNASDAVRARRALTTDPLYEGKVVISLRAEEKNSWQLIVEDDGIGMSERVLTGPLLEFGESFWNSDVAQDEFRGLVSANLRQAGRYGIGFFSTLMATTRIEVTSRRWDAAQDQARKLTFREGLQLRPLVLEAGNASLGQFSTRVVLHIDAELVEDILTIFPNSDEQLKVTLKDIVAQLCLCLDCDVFTSESQGRFEIAHSRKWYAASALEWVRQVSFANNRVDKYVDSYLDKIAPFVRVILGQDGELCGRAAISFDDVSAGVSSVGRLASGSSRRVTQFSTSFVGGIECDSDGPRRYAGDLRNPDDVKRWASEQAQLLCQAKLRPLENYCAAINVAAFGGDPTPIATILINRKATPLVEVYKMLLEGSKIFAVTRTSIGSATQISNIQHRPEPHQGIGFRPDELKFVITTMEGWYQRQYHTEGIYHAVRAGGRSSSSFLSCLERYASTQRRQLLIEVVPNIQFATYKGKESIREKMSVGMPLCGEAVKLSLTQM